MNTTQEQSLALVFAWADENHLELVDLNDVSAVITYLTSPEGKEQLRGIGGVSTATAGVILRAVSALQSQGGDEFFGVPGFDTADLIRTAGGKGVISLLQVGDISSRPDRAANPLQRGGHRLRHANPQGHSLRCPRPTWIQDSACVARRRRSA